MGRVRMFKVRFPVRHFSFFQAHWRVTFLMQERELPWTLQGAHRNYDVQFENPTLTVAAFILNHDHEMSISAWGYYISCSTIGKRFCISTVLSNILFALETTHPLDGPQETFQMLSKSTLNITQWLPLGWKQYLFLIKAFVILMKLPASCIHSVALSVRRLWLSRHYTSRPSIESVWSQWAKKMRLE